MCTESVSAWSRRLHGIDVEPSCHSAALSSTKHEKQEGRRELYRIYRQDNENIAMVRCRNETECGRSISFVLHCHVVPSVLTWGPL